MCTREIRSKTMNIGMFKTMKEKIDSPPVMRGFLWKKKQQGECHKSETPPDDDCANHTHDSPCPTLYSGNDDR